MIPRSVWTDKIAWDYYDDVRKWSYTLAEEFPRGWWKAFGLMLCEELREDLIKYYYLDKFRFEQIKSKFGQLRVYTGPLPRDSNVTDIIDKYTTLSENICEFCGKPDVPMIGHGWIEPECFDCYCKRAMEYRKTTPTIEELKIEYENEKTSDDDPGRMADVRRFSRWSKEDGEYKRTDCEVDISATAQKIREAYYGRMHR